MRCGNTLNVKKITYSHSKSYEAQNKSLADYIFPSYLMSACHLVWNIKNRCGACTHLSFIPKDCKRLARWGEIQFCTGIWTPIMNIASRYNLGICVVEAHLTILQRCLETETRASVCFSISWNTQMCACVESTVKDCCNDTDPHEPS